MCNTAKCVHIEEMDWGGVVQFGALLPLCVPTCAPSGQEGLATVRGGAGRCLWVGGWGQETTSAAELLQVSGAL